MKQDRSNPPEQADEEQPMHIEDHPDFGSVLDEIEKFGNYKKPDLVAYLYDDSGEGETKQALNLYSKGKLLAMVIDSIHGATFQ